MSKRKHQIEIEKLRKIESDLRELISKTENKELRNKYAEWNRQRLICDISFAVELEK